MYSNNATSTNTNTNSNISNIQTNQNHHNKLKNSYNSTRNNYINDSKYPSNANHFSPEVSENSNLHFPIGRSSFSEQQLAENYTAALDEIARAKPSSTKGRYIKKAVMSSAMGPGIPVEVGASGSSDSED